MKKSIITFYRKNKKIIFLILRIIISVSLIAFLVNTQFKDIQTALIILKAANKPLLLLSFSTHAFGIWITAVRWKILLNTQKVYLGTGTLTLSVMIGFFFNNFLPTSIGGDVFRTYDVAKKGKMPVGTSASVILVERFSGVISAATYATLALFMGFTAIGGQSVIVPILIFFMITIILGFIIINPSVLRLGKLFNRFKFLKKLKEGLSNVYHTLLSFKQYKLVLINVLVLSFLLQFMVILNYYLAARALGIELGLTAFIFIVPVVSTIAMLPFSIGGIGIRESSLAFILVVMGVTNEKAGLQSLLIFLMLIIVGIIGGIIYLVRPYFE
ncbi:MAG: flippase-like domain-containing protein, partial [Actinomycetia bacterium]|nr:flippase-like domain-containing protein [Actinomycetes bacterium]